MDKFGDSKQVQQEIKKCKAITKSGNQCNLKPGESGYCHIHHPEKVAVLKASQKEAEQRAKAKIDEETKWRTQQLEQIDEAISTLGDKLQQYRECRKEYQILESVVNGLYIEIEKLTKKAPAEPITELALEQINDVIRDQYLRQKVAK